MRRGAAHPTASGADRALRRAGDIIRLGLGEGVPEDCRLLEADGLEIDESALTGEALPVAEAPYWRGR
ncbi:P-type ATPase [Nocardia sp. NPDC004260]